MPGVLFCLSNFDVATAWGFYWLSRLVPLAKELRYRVYDCNGEKAIPDCVYTNVTKLVSENKRHCFIGLGHGSSCIFTGQYKIRIFRCCEQPKDACKVDCYLMYSCVTARGLGPDFINKGVEVYWGWDHFAIVGKPGTLLEWLQRALYVTWGKFLSGVYTIGDAYNEAIKIWKEKEEEAKKRGDYLTARAFKWQYTHCKLLGNAKYMIYTRPVQLLAMAPVIAGVGAVLRQAF